jgi:hypothetical protein
MKYLTTPRLWRAVTSLTPGFARRYSYLTAQRYKENKID